MIYFTSDLHLGHATVIKHRHDFADINEMNETLIRNINSVVTDSDTLYIIGDLSNRITVEEANEYIGRIRGHKILIRGNHDDEYDPELFAEITDYKEFEYGGKDYILMHYPLKCWNKMRFGSVQVHGHIHSTPKYNEHNHRIGRLQYDVGVDANEFRPVSIDEIAAWADSAPWQDYKGLYHHTDLLE